MSKLRELYDKLYVGLDTLFLAHQTAAYTRRCARVAHPKPDFDRDFREKVLPYWRQFHAPRPKKFWYKTYGPSTEPVDPRYVPYNIWVRYILPHFNTLSFAQALQDKNMHSLFVPNMRRPETVVKNIAGVFYDDALNLLSQEEAVRRCKNTGRILAKPSVGSGGGANIRFYDSAALTDEEIDGIFRQYKRNFIIQKKQEQHEALARLGAGSLNTCRINTFFYKGEVHILSAILRVGVSSSEVDNISQGGYQCEIRPGGHLAEQGFTHINDRWEHPDAYPNGIRFRDVTVPGFDRAVEVVSAHARKMGHFKIIGWDIAIDPDSEPVLVEYNVIPGQDQESNGPTFGELTDEVLEEVFGRRGQPRQ